VLECLPIFLRWRNRTSYHMTLQPHLNSWHKTSKSSKKPSKLATPVELLVQGKAEMAEKLSNLAGQLRYCKDHIDLLEDGEPTVCTICHFPFTRGFHPVSRTWLQRLCHFLTVCPPQHIGKPPTLQIHLGRPNHKYRYHTFIPVLYGF